MQSWSRLVTVKTKPYKKELKQWLHSLCLWIKTGTSCMQIAIKQFKPVCTQAIPWIIYALDISLLVQCWGGPLAEGVSIRGPDRWKTYCPHWWWTFGCSRYVQERCRIKGKAGHLFGDFYTYLNPSTKEKYQHCTLPHENPFILPVVLWLWERQDIKMLNISHL